MASKTPERLGDVKITPEAWQIFEKAVDRAAKPLPDGPRAKRAAKGGAAARRNGKVAKPAWPFGASSVPSVRR